VKFLYQQPWAENNFWLNTLLFRKKGSRHFRAAFIQKLKEKGIESRPIFFPLHLQAPFRKYSPRKLPVAENCSGINLPSSFDISEEEICFVADSIKKILS
jgi:perosamine synthetase